MCDICGLKCERKDCTEVLCVHIGDFCVEREQVKVRCPQHPPRKGNGWVVFHGVFDDMEGEEPGQRGDWYMKLEGEEPAGYGIGESGDIVPNLDWQDESTMRCYAVWSFSTVHPTDLAACVF